LIDLLVLVEDIVVESDPGATFVDVIDPTGEADVCGNIPDVDELEAAVDRCDPVGLLESATELIEVSQAAVIDAETMPDSVMIETRRDGLEREPAVVSGEVGDVELPKRLLIAAAVGPQRQVERTEVKASSPDLDGVRDSRDGLLVARAGMFALAAIFEAAALANESHYRALLRSSLPVEERIMADTTRCRGPCTSAGAR